MESSLNVTNTTTQKSQRPQTHRGATRLITEALGRRLIELRLTDTESKMFKATAGQI